MLGNMYPEVQVDVNIDNVRSPDDILNEGLSVAPGEGQIPTNILMEEDWDVKSFPHLHPDGRYGLHHKREIKLSPLQYFNQRLLNKDIRFSSTPSFVYAALGYLEKQQLERNMNIAYNKGTSRMTNEGMKVFHLDDAFAVLGNTKNSPKFWQDAELQLIAKLENLGPFMFFFTLSCAEKRWMENLHVILKRRLGDEVQFSYKYNHDGEQSDPEATLLINDMPYEDFLKENGIELNIHEEMRKNVLTLTRNFDHRVKMFMKNIVMGANNPMNCKFFSYRVEFQARGAGHVHGVLWIDMDAVMRDDTGNILYEKDVTGREVPKKVFPGVKQAIDNIKNSIPSAEDLKCLEQFTDNFITVDLTNPEVKDIVSEVNVHKHTRACHTKGPFCRFSYPKFPTTKTIISQPYKNMNLTDDDGNQLGDDEKKKLYLKLQAKMSKVKEHLENEEFINELKRLSPEEQISALCSFSGLSVEEYYQGLSYSSCSYTVHLKRRIQEIYVNPYNTEWIKAWNGNMDIQICLDFFAVITYITDYVSKDDTSLMNILLEAAKNCQSESAKQRMRIIKDTFLTHRQMGEAEVYYRIFPGLYLKNSNVKTVFLATGFPENRSHYMKKINPEDEHLYDEESLVRIDDKESKYHPKPSMIEKYVRRPTALKDMCLMQFVKMYESVSSVPKNTTWNDDISDKVSPRENLEILEDRRHKDFEKILISPDNKCEMSADEYVDLLLPKHIILRDPEPGESKYMKLRNVSNVVRLHKFNSTKERHEYLYSELLLYRPFMSEEELYRNDEKKCAELYCEKVNDSEGTKIANIKRIVMEYLESVIEGKEKAEAIIQSSAGDVLDPEYEQNELDGQGDLEEHPEYPNLIPPAEISETPSKGESYYPAIKLMPVEELYEKSRKLDREQMLVVQEGIQFAKSILKQSAGSKVIPRPPLVMVHGGAGSGKSTVISTLIEWVERLLRKEGDNPDQPYVLACAPTGTAAAVIGGQTLHHIFSFSFGNEYMPLKDKPRDVKRNALRNLKMVIIDEISMVKADLFYQLHLRLQEVMQQPDKLFGGVSLFCFGDLLQLRPVQARYVFEEPICNAYRVTHALDPLWSAFDVINLVQNHRQGNDMIYAEILNRIRVGSVTQEDCELLQTRVRPVNDPEIPDDAMYVTCTNQSVNDINQARLQGLETESVELLAININSSCKNFHPPIGRGGTVHTTPFYNKVTLKVDARVMLTFNVDTADGLTNGAMGQVLGYERNVKGEVAYVVVAFDGEQVGAERRKKFPSLQRKYHNDKSTPISRHEFAYSLSKKCDTSAQAKVIQFPLRLAFAATAHKFQGQTVRKPRALVVDLRTVREPAQAYVMLSRVQELNQLFILEHLPVDKLRPAEIALQEVDRLNAISRNNHLPEWYDTTNDCSKIVFLNTRSLQMHFHDVRCNWQICSSDLLCLSETWLLSDNSENLMLPDFSKPHLVVAGRGKGLASYAKDPFVPFQDLNATNCQISKFSSSAYDVISVYRSSSSPISYTLESIDQLTDSSKLTIVGGDMNVCVLKNPQNKLTNGMESLGFHQLVDEATHVLGGALDHVYVRFPDGSTPKDRHRINIHVLSVYWSDHDAVMVSVWPQKG